MIALVAMLTIAATGHAMSYEQARNEALFLTDKMAYELNLTDEQYEAAYEINLDYLMGVTSYDDVYATYWERRNLDMSYVLLEWQWQAFCAASYFYRPLYWDGGYWHFGIYARYPHRDYFYFGRPVFYASYRGGHAWHVIGGRGYYYGRREHFRPVAGRTHFGMLDRWNRGDFRNHHRYSGGGSRYNSGYRNSSTRYTVGNNRGNSYGRSLGNRRTTYENNRMYGSRPTTATEQRPSSRYSSSSSYGNRTNGSGSYHGSGSFSGSGRSSASFGGSHSSGSFSGSHGSGSFSGSGRSSASFGGSHSSGSFSGSRSSGSFGGGHSSGSFGGSRSSGSFSGGHSSSGGRSFGGHR